MSASPKVAVVRHCVTCPTMYKSQYLYNNTEGYFLSMKFNIFCFPLVWQPGPRFLWSPRSNGHSFDSINFKLFSHLSGVFWKCFSPSHIYYPLIALLLRLWQLSLGQPLHSILLTRCALSPCKHCTINSKINGTPSSKGVYLPISKLHSILTVANLLAYNNNNRVVIMGKLTPLSGTIYFAVDGTYIAITHALCKDWC